MIVPYQLLPSTPTEQNWHFVNENFRALEMRGLGSRTTATTSGSLTIAAGGYDAVEIGIVDTNNPYKSGLAHVQPRLDLYVDTDNTAGNLFPAGASLSAAQKKAMVSLLERVTPSTGHQGTLVLRIKNEDASTRTYYYHVNASYLPAPATGQYQ